MRIKLRLFSIAKDIAGFDEREIDVANNSTASDVLEFLSARDERFREWKSSLRFSVNYEYVANHHPLKEGDEVGVIPPVSGG